MGSVPEPPWPPEGTDTFDPASALCNIRFTPSIVTGILLRLLQAHFADQNNIRDDNLKAYTWSQDDPASGTVTSKIMIEPLYQYDPRKLQQRPALLVFRQGLEARRLPLGSRTLPTVDPKTGIFTGDKYFVPVTCTHVIRCVAGGAFAADRLGEEVFYRLLEYFPAIKKEFPFSDIEIRMLSQPEKVDEHSENFKVDVGIPWVHVHGWTLATESPILKKVRLINDLFVSTKYEGHSS